MSAAAVLVLGAGAFLPATSAQAATTSPWWHLNSGALPSVLQPGTGENEVQQLTVSATGGEFLVFCETCEAEGHEAIGFAPFDVTPEALQTTLEGLYGAGNVEVPKGQGNEAGDEPYEIVFTGDLAHRPVPLLAAFSNFFGTPLEGGREEASVAEVAKGVGDGQIVLTAANLGDGAVDGEASPVTLLDKLPPGLEAVSIEGKAGIERAPLECDLASLTCTFKETLQPYNPIEIFIGVVAKAGAPLGEEGEANEFSVSGGGAPSASIARPVPIGGEPARFGVETYELSNEEEGGASTTQAGSHPFQQTTTFVLNQTFDHVDQHGVLVPQPVTLPKDVSFRWPPGLIGNPRPLPRCPLVQFLAGEPVHNGCPPQTAVGVARSTAELIRGLGFVDDLTPLFNLEPSLGEPARLGFLTPGGPVYIDPSVRSGGDYGITVSASNITQLAGILSSQVTVWGVPGDSRHDSSRGFGCLAVAAGAQNPPPCNALEAQHPPAFLTLPTSCSGAPLQTSVQAASWADPLDPPPPFAADPPMPALDGCNRLPFGPEIVAEPTSNAATSPTGLNFDLSFNDEGLIAAEGLAQSQIKKAVVTLPEGFTTNPSVAEGLHACSLHSYETETLGSEPGSGCPENSKIGDVEIQSPLVEQKVHGSLFVAAQRENPYDNLLTIYLVAKNPEIGLLVKQALKVEPNRTTGQLSTEVDNIPQLPFSRFHLSFRQGQRSPLITPPACGTYTVEADLYPYSAPEVPLHRESSFQITQGPEGLPCPSGGVPPFHPNLLAGSENPTAGAYSPFYTDITRKDSEQEITHFSIKLPPGVIGKLAGIPYCSDAQIAAAEAREHEGGGGEEEASPSCLAASQIGHSNVGSGVGNVLAYAPGKVYLAGPYHGSNLSMVSITAAKVGPFDLGTVVVRFALRVDPETAEVFVDATGSDPIPHIVDGIPVHLRDIRAYVDRPNFTFNPTSCAPTFTASTVLGSGLDFVSEADDQPVTVSSPFQAADCASLKFKPKLALSLKGSTKRGGNPAFKAVVTYPYQPSANIASAQVTLPPSEFLDNAHIGTVCTRVQFKEGTVPGEKCPPRSVYGFAKAVTPVFEEALEGPVYLRSTGTGPEARQLPDLVAALHNKQVDIALVGYTEGTRGGGIRNTFTATPDAPVTKFTLELKGGKKGLLENSRNLCAHPNRADALFTGHNGKEYNTTPKVAAKCPKAKKAGKGKRHH